jgi:hypothetical protein
MDNKGGHRPPTEHDRGDHLMGLRHGDNINLDFGRLCVPLEEKATTRWTAVSAASLLHVTVKSLRGGLAHNSRANEGFEIIISQASKPISDADVRVVARMPHHDRKMPGGHGPANDPDAHGVAAKPAGNGRYMLNTVDFNMGGAWLFEVRVKRGSDTTKAYFAARVGQE